MGTRSGPTRVPLQLVRPREPSGWVCTEAMTQTALAVTESTEPAVGQAALTQSNSPH
jgi:hypothetical protein